MSEINQDVNTNEDESAEKNLSVEKKKKRRKNESGKGVRGLIQFVQHALITVAVVTLVVVISGSSVIVQDLYGNKRYTYTLFTVDQNEKYEDSHVFNSIFEKAVSDIIRFGVIRSQMETDGKFDGNKIIDVTAYNDRTSSMPERYVTVKYYLKDLLKWESYGLEYSSYNMGSKETEKFLSDQTTITVLDSENQYGYSTDYYYLKTPPGIYTSTVSDNSLSTPKDVQNENYEILINRYKTVEGKNIEDYTSEWGSYLKLCDNVVTAMQNLAHNYDEYLQYGEYYNFYNTNIRYCIEKTVGNHTEYFTNMIDDSIDGTQNADFDVAGFFDEVFSGKMNGNMSRYIYYSPDEMIYESNSGIDVEKVRSIIKDYSYAYPENIRLWIGVNASYIADDALAYGYIGFQNYVPNIWKWLVLAVSAIILYFALFIYMTAKSGRAVDNEGNSYIRLTAFDKIPTEAALIFGVLSAGVITVVIYISMRILRYSLYEYIHIFDNELIDSIWFKVLVGAAVFVIDSVFLFFYYSFVRRIKAKTLWKSSYMSRFFNKCRSLIAELYNNSGVAFRTWGPYVLFLLFNLFMAVLTILMTDFGISFLFIIMITVAVDAVIGMILYRDVKERQNIVNGIEKIAAGDFSYQVEQDKVHGYNTALAKSVNSIGNGIKNAVENSMKDERMKTELITNVSHDIKTPLTSIINYVDLIKREEVDNERVRNYIRILDEKSQRLKQLTDDLVEASKISSGNISLNFERINLTELLKQTIGEFSEKFDKKNLSIVMDVKASNAVIEADSRRIWRIMENLFNNIYKYALEGTRVYITVYPLKNKVVMKQEWVEISIKNISATELNCNPEELTERFIRGDESRTTEGSGLGLSIAKNLTEAQKGTFKISLDGDLFKVVMTFPIIQGEKME